MSKSIFLKISILIITLSFISCSSDDNNPDPIETPIVTTEDFSVTMDENPENGQIIGTVQGGTNQGNIIFSITAQNPSAAFAIDPASGELTVADANLFKFERNPVITGDVKVANESVFENSRVTITLNEVSEDNVYEGGVVLYTQEEVDAFGANNYTHITRQLLIGTLQYEPSEILTLSPLSSLRNVGKHITIRDNALLENLDGLENIEALGSYLLIDRNPSLNSIATLSKITVVEDYLYIDHNKALTSLHGLENLTSVRGELGIFSNENLVDVTSLANLSHIGQDLTIGANEKLEGVDFSGLASVHRTLRIYHNRALTNLDGLSNLNSIGGNLDILENSLLSDFCGLSNVFMGGYFNGSYRVIMNSYDPTEQDLIDGNCR